MLSVPSGITLYGVDHRHIKELLDVVLTEWFTVSAKVKTKIELKTPKK